MSTVTFSGFDKNEVYNDIIQCYLKNDYTRLCYLTAELVCTKNEIKQIINLVINEYSSNRISSNLTELDSITQYIHNVQSFNGKNLCYNNSFQKLLCELVILVGVLRKKQSKLLLEQTSFADIEHLIERYGKVAYDEIKNNFTNKVSNELLQLLNMIYYFLKKSHLQYLRVIFSYLIFSKQYSLDEIDFIEIRDVTRTQRKDVIWYLWKVLLIHVEHSQLNDEKIRNYIQASLKLYSTHFSKKTRITRINLLLYCLVVLYNKNVKERPIPDHILKYASRNIHIVYQETLKY